MKTIFIKKIFGNIFSGSYRNNFERKQNSERKRQSNWSACLGRGGGGGGYGFRRQNNRDEDEVEILKDAIFVQNLPRNITRDDIFEAFSSVGPIKVRHCEFHRTGWEKRAVFL